MHRMKQRLGFSGKGIGHISKVTLHQVSTEMVTICRYTISVCNSLLPSVGWEMNSETKSVTVLYGWEGNHGSRVASSMHHRLCGIPL